jgi:hypothetical protein
MSLSSASSLGQGFSGIVEGEDLRSGDEDLEGGYFCATGEGYLRGTAGWDGLSALRSPREAMIEQCGEYQCFFGCGGKHSPIVKSTYSGEQYGTSSVNDLFGTLDVERERSFGKPFDLVSPLVRRNRYLKSSETFADRK